MSVRVIFELLVVVINSSAIMSALSHIRPSHQQMCCSYTA